MKGGIFMGMKRWMDRTMRRLRCAMAGRSLALPLIGGGVLLLVATLIRGVCGDPYQSGLLLLCGEIIPPVWVMTLCWMGWYVVLGGVFVWVTFDGQCDPPTVSRRYRGGMAYLAMLMLGFLWYPTFFCAGRVFTSALIVLGVLALCVVAGLIYWRSYTYRLAGVILFVHALFLLWMLLINLGVALG
jgi:tryptophan-rich sensory protein